MGDGVGGLNGDGGGGPDDDGVGRPDGDGGGGPDGDGVGGPDGDGGGGPGGDGAFQMPDLVWTDVPPNYQPQDHPFTGDSGIQVDTTNFRPIHYFKLYVNDDLINHITCQTNIYSEQYRNAHPNPPRHSDIRHWEFTNPREMQQFLGLLLLMGIIRKPTYDMYWSTDPLYSSSIFNQTMKRMRFRLLLRFLHFNDNTHQPDRRDNNRDRLYKLRPLLDHLYEKFQEVYVPSRNLAVDESLILWKGQLLFRQYIPMKRARFRIKVLYISLFVLHLGIFQAIYSVF